MFTGIIEEKGILKDLRRDGASCVMTIGCRAVLEDTKVGDSIAVNGVCLTVTSVRGDSFTADLMAETLARSALGSLAMGAALNLERAMPADGRFGGHIVSGHIDGTGTVASVRREDNAVWYEVEAAPELLRYIVEKGSIALDGISLTVAYVDERCFKVSIIPHTLAVTTLPDRRVGDVVNLECDIIGKYVERLLTHPSAEAGGSEGPTSGSAPDGALTEDFLRECGY